MRTQNYKQRARLFLEPPISGSRERVFFSRARLPGCRGRRGASVISGGMCRAPLLLAPCSLLLAPCALLLSSARHKTRHDTAHRATCLEEARILFVREVFVFVYCRCFCSAAHLLNTPALGSPRRHLAVPPQRATGLRGRALPSPPSLAKRPWHSCMSSASDCHLLPVFFHPDW